MRRYERDHIEASRQLLGDSCSAKHSGERADQRDAYLNGCKEFVGVFRDIEGDPGISFPILGLLMQAPLARRYDCYLGQREQIVCEDQNQNGDDFNRNARHMHVRLFLEGLQYSRNSDFGGVLSPAWVICDPRGIADSDSS